MALSLEETRRVLEYFDRLSPEERRREYERLKKAAHEETVFRVNDLARAFEVTPMQLQPFSVRGEGNVILADDLAKVRSAVYQLDPDKVLPGLSEEECCRLFQITPEQLTKTFRGITMWRDEYGQEIMPLRDVLEGYYYYCFRAKQ